MFKKISDWAATDADWYQFWYPQSGLVGGMIGGTIVIVVMIILTYI